MIIYYGGEGGMPKLHDLSFLLNQIKNKVCIEDKYYGYADTINALWRVGEISKRVVFGRKTCKGSIGIF